MKIDNHKASDHYLSRINSIEVESEAVKNRMHRFVNIAKAMYSKGATSNGRTLNFTFVARKSKLIAIGQNNYNRVMDKYVPLLRANYKHCGESSYIPSLHSELSAILRLGLEDCSDLDFYNVRIDRKCHCRNSCCCANCFKTLNIVGYKHLYFYNDDMKICML